MPGHCCVQACSSGEWPGNRGWFQPHRLVGARSREVNVGYYRVVLHESVACACITSAPMRTHTLARGIAKVRFRSLVAAQHVVSAVVDNMCAPVQQENASIGSAVQLPPGLGSVWAFVNPIINEVPKVNAVLVLQYHVVENTARVQDVSYLKNGMAWQWNLENPKPLLQHSKHTLNGLADGLASAHSTRNQSFTYSNRGGRQVVPVF